MRFGLSDDILQAIIHELSKHDHIKKAILFGSRARGDHRHNSDINLAIDCAGKLPVGLYADLDEAAGIYKIDVIELRGLSNDKLLSNINLDGVVIYPLLMKSPSWKRNTTRPSAVSAASTETIPGNLYRASAKVVNNPVPLSPLSCED